MSILDEITKEKQRLSEALARVDAQRDKLTNQLTELGATERVLARYSKGTQTRKTRSGKTPIWMRRIPSPSAPSMSPCDENDRAADQRALDAAGDRAIDQQEDRQHRAVLVHRTLCRP